MLKLGKYLAPYPHSLLRAGIWWRFWPEPIFTEVEMVAERRHPTAALLLIGGCKQEPPAPTPSSLIHYLYGLIQSCPSVVFHYLLYLSHLSSDGPRLASSKARPSIFQALPYFLK